MQRLPRDPDGEAAGGTIRSALETARVQQRSGHDVWVANTSPTPWTSGWQGVRLLSLRLHPWARMAFGGRRVDLREHLAAMALTRRVRFDAVHVHAYDHVHRLRGRLRFLHVHNSPSWSLCDDPARVARRASRFWATARGSDAQIAVSRFVAEQLRAGADALAANPSSDVRPHIRVLHNGVDLERFSAVRWREAGSDLRARMSVPHGAVVFLFAGAIAPDKGVLDLAEAFAAIAADLPHVHLAVAGSGSLWNRDPTGEGRYADYERAVRSALQPWVHQGRVHFLGAVAAGAMPAVHAASDVLVLPSTVQEASGLVVLEALASSRPVLATHVGGIPEVVNDECGVLVPPGVRGALALSMRTLAMDAALRRRLATHAAQSAAAYTWDRSAGELDALYADLAGSARHRHALSSQG